MTVLASSLLADARGVVDALDARVLLGYVLGVSQAEVIADCEVPPSASLRFKELLARRFDGEPLAYILGYREFYGRKFAVSSQVLVPRPDSETLIEAVIASVPRDFSGTFVDLGTGSGCLILTLLSEYPAARGIGVDKNPGAVSVALANARSLGIAARCEIVLGDFADLFAVQGEVIYVSNPPYIARAEIDTLDRDVRDYEPRIALDGGEDGLECYRILARALPSSASVFLEVGEGQAADVAGIFGQSFKAFRDLQGIERVIGIL